MLDDEPRVMALLATAYEQPVEPYVLAKLRRACERWTEGDKALAHIHLAHAGLPPCGEAQALRLFVADELIDAGVTPAALMKAQGFDPAPLDLLKANFNPAQLRWAAGNGRDSGRWSGGTSVDTAGIKEFIARLALEAARRAARLLLRPTETKPALASRRATDRMNYAGCIVGFVKRLARWCSLLAKPGPVALFRRPYDA